MINQGLVRASIIESFHRTLELMDCDTGMHCLRVSDLAVQFAKTLQLTNQDIENIQQGALLHDLGFIGIPDSILWKPGSHNERDKEILRCHAEYGYRILQPMVDLVEVAEIVYCHHEQWNGQGYPRGLKKDEIPRNVRIISIVNEWDRLRMDKPYQPGMSEQAVKCHLKEQSGQMFDPELVAQFLNWVG